MANDFYEILGVPRDSSQTEIQRAFEELTNQNIRNFSENPVDTSLISKLELAYDVLSDPLQRLEYDRTLSHSPEIDHSLIDIQIEYSRNSVSGSQDDQLVYALVELGLSSGSERSRMSTYQPFQLITLGVIVLLLTGCIAIKAEPTPTPTSMPVPPTPTPTPVPATRALLVIQESFNASE